MANFVTLNCMNNEAHSHVLFVGAGDGVRTQGRDYYSFSIPKSLPPASLIQTGLCQVHVNKGAATAPESFYGGGSE